MSSNDYCLIAISRLALLAIFAVTCATSIAQTGNSKTSERLNLAQQESAAQTDEEEKLDDSFRRFGSAAGAAYQCTAEADIGKW